MVQGTSVLSDVVDDDDTGAFGAVRCRDIVVSISCVSRERDSAATVRLPVSDSPDSRLVTAAESEPSTARAISEYSEDQS